MTTTATRPAPEAHEIPYHRLAAGDRHRWWRPVLATLAVLVAALAAQVALFTVAWVGAAIAGARVDQDGLPVLPDAAETAVALAGIALALPIVLVAARLLQKRRPGTLSSVAGRLRWGWLARCALLTVPTMALVVVGAIGLLAATDADPGSVTGDARWLGLGPVLAASAMLLVLIPLQAAAEEYAFRGWLLQALGTYARSPWVAVAVQAVLFSAAHGLGTPWGFVDLVVFGGLAGWLTVRTGGLEAAIALHVVNNLTWMLLGAATGNLSLDETAADLPWQVFVVDVPVLAGYAAAVWWLARRRGVRSTTTS